MAGRQVSSESHNHLQFIVQIQADSGASAWPAGSPGKKRADNAGVQYGMTWCTTAPQNRPSHAGTSRILCSAVLRWGSKMGSPEGHRLRSGIWQCQSNVLHFQEHSCRELTGKQKAVSAVPGHPTTQRCPVWHKTEWDTACQRLASAQSPLYHLADLAVQLV